MVGPELALLDLEKRLNPTPAGDARAGRGPGGVRARPAGRARRVPDLAAEEELELRVGLEEKRREAESRASDVQHKASAMRSQYEEMLRQVCS